MIRSKGWASVSTRNTLRSVSTTTTAERSIISYDITQTKQRFMKSNHDAEKPTDNVWIRISRVFLPTFWYPRCNKWVRHPESLHAEHTRWQNAKDAQQGGKQDQHKRPNHYGPRNQENIKYERGDTNKQSSTSYNRDHNHNKQSRNDHG
jgi:hypothetical protein